MPWLRGPKHLRSTILYYLPIYDKERERGSVNKCVNCEKFDLKRKMAYPSMMNKQDNQEKTFSS